MRSMVYLVRFDTGFIIRKAYPTMLPGAVP